MQGGRKYKSKMTNQQLYLVIGIPSFIALLGILTNALVFQSLNSRMTSLEARMLNLENKLEARILNLENKLEARLINLENTFTTRFDLLMGRLIDLEKEIHRGH